MKLPFSLSEPRVICVITGFIEFYLFCHNATAIQNIEFVLRKQGYFEKEILSIKNLDEFYHVNSTEAIENYLNFDPTDQTSSDDLHLDVADDKGFIYHTILDSPNITAEDKKNITAELASKYIFFNEVSNLWSCMLKVAVSVLVDVAGYWASRVMCHGFTLVSLSLILFLKPTSSLFQVMFSYPLYSGSMIAVLFVHITCGNTFPTLQGMYTALYKMGFTLDSYIFYWYKGASFDHQYYFWMFFLLAQPFMWYRTFTCLPRRHFDLEKLETSPIGWKTRHDKIGKKKKQGEEDTVGDDWKEEVQGFKVGTPVSKKKPSAFNQVITYFKETYECFTLNNCLLLFWFTLEMQLGYGVFSQIVTYSYWKLPDHPTETDHKSKIIEEYLTSITLAFTSQIVIIPALTACLDYLASYVHKAWGVTVYEGQIFSMLTQMIYVTASNIIFHFGLTYLAVDDKITYNFESPKLLVFYFFVLISSIGQSWMVRNIYIMSANKSVGAQQKLLSIANILQGLTHVLGSEFTHLVKWFGGDWDRIYKIIGCVMFVNFIVPVWLYYLHFVKKCVPRK